jgi:hypothetical protein
MRILLLILLLLVGVPNKERTLVVTRKMIQVSGQTSLGGFNCDYNKIGLKDTLFLDAVGKVKEIVFDVPVEDFSCGNFLLNRDFRKTLQAEKFPQAIVKVKNLRSNYGYYTCDLAVDLVGKKLNFTDLMLKRVADGLTGELVLSFEQLELKAPSKMGGLVKVDEKLNLSIFLGL